MPPLRHATLADAAVAETASFLDAARELSERNVSAIAVLDGARRVVGLFTHDDMLKGLFPGYLAELRHTAFLTGDTESLAAQLGKAAGDSVTKHMRDPLTVDVDTSAVHVAERFLHCEWGALAVTENDRFVGMIDEAAFCRGILERLTRGE